MTYKSYYLIDMDQEQIVVGFFFAINYLINPTLFTGCTRYTCKKTYRSNPTA